MLITQSRHAHITELDGALAAAVRKQVALSRMKLGSGNNFRQLLHIYRLNVDDICSSQSVVVNQEHALNAVSLMLKFHKLTRKSSADKNVSPSELMEMELMW